MACYIQCSLEIESALQSELQGNKEYMVPKVNCILTVLLSRVKYKAAYNHKRCMYMQWYTQTREC